MRILLGYSGDLDTSVAIPWLKAHYQAEVITATIDLGKGRELEEVRDRALAAGAVRAHVLDGRDQFARDFVLPSLKADALAGDRVVMAVSLSRPLIARKLVELAEIERADAVAHGAARSLAGPARLDVLLRAVGPAVKIIAVTREWSIAPHDRAAYARARRIPLPLDLDCTTDTNLWGRSIRCSTPAAESAYALTKPLAECPDESAHVEIAFDRGIPKAINGVFMPLLELIASLGTIGGAHGVGRVSMDGHLCEAPAAFLLHAAHRELQARAITGDLEAFARAVSLKYVEVVREGLWFTPLREALDAFVEKVQERVTGVVRLELLKGYLVKH
jgi:argininosuccinate synthase